MDFNGKLLKKSLGQNFITDANLLKAIVQDAQITPATNVLEIGTGAGTLTKVLSEHAYKVVSYEIDLSLEPIIKHNLDYCQNTHIIFQDFLQAKEQDISKLLGNGYKVVANLPYYITTPIIFKLLDFQTPPDSITIMVQLEVGQRIVAKPGTKDYGALTVGIDSKYQAKLTRKVRKEMFIPRPNVDSCIAHMTYRPYSIDNYSLFSRVVKSAFHMRRKQLVNNLSSDFGISKDTLRELLQSINLDPNIRGEMISTQQFIELSKALEKYIIE